MVFAYDKFNYARYLVYSAQMATLPVDHRDVHWNLWKVIFSVQVAGESPFGRILVDHTIDVSVNKDNEDRDHDKTGAVNRFYLTAEYRCAFLDQLRSLVQAK